MAFEKLTDYLDNMPKRGIPACGISVYKDGKEIYRHITGYKDAAQTVPAGEDDLYFLYSSSKVLLAVTAMAAIEDGYFTLETPVGDIIPEYKHLTLQNDGNPTPIKNTLRIVDLLTMTGGFSYDMHSEQINECIRKNPGADTADIVRAVAGMPLLFEPSTHWKYSLCHDIMAGVIAAATGEGYAGYIKRRIADPMGMTDWYFHADTPELLSRVSQQYVIRQNPNYVREIFPNTVEYILTKNYESGGAGFITTMDQYVKLAVMLAAKGLALNGTRILKEETVAEMQKNRLNEKLLFDYCNGAGNGGYGYGLGVRTLLTQKDEKSGNTSRSSIGEFGWGGAAGTFILADPKENLALFYVQQVLNMVGSVGDNETYTYQSHPHNMIRDLIYEELGM